MTEILASALKETAKEVSISSNEIKPKFFDEMPKVENTENKDKPLIKKSIDGEEFDGTINLITRNESLEGDVHPITGVPFERRTIETSIKIEGVFPEFDSEFDAQMSEELFKESDVKQFNECNKQLKETIENNPDLEKQFSKEQLEQINNGDTPDGYVWHHDATPGKIQLVDFETHANTGHTGGRVVWGGGNENR